MGVSVLRSLKSFLDASAIALASLAVLPSSAIATLWYPLDGTEIVPTPDGRTFEEISSARPRPRSSTHRDDHWRQCLTIDGEPNWLVAYNYESLGSRENVISAAGTYSIKRYNIHLIWEGTKPQPWLSDYSESYLVNCSVPTDEAVQRIHAGLWSSFDLVGHLQQHPPRRTPFTPLTQQEHERFLAHGLLAGTWIDARLPCTDQPAQDYVSFSALTGRFHTRFESTTGATTSGDYAGWLAIKLDNPKQGELYFRYENGTERKFYVKDWSVNQLTIVWVDDDADDDNGRGSQTVKRCGKLSGITANDILGGLYGAADILDIYAGEIDKNRVIRQDRLAACAWSLAHAYRLEYEPANFLEQAHLFLGDIFIRFTTIGGLTDKYAEVITSFACDDVPNLPRPTPFQ
ncbi:MAG: hypothetical protein ABG776_13280 [Cyanobacteria bacterium J06555_13]